MAGNPCYILTITTDVKKNDINIAQLKGTSSEKGSAKNQKENTSGKESSSQNVNNAGSQAQNNKEGTQGNSSQNVNDATAEGAPVHDEGSTEKPKKVRSKQVIFLTARVHPGESNSQFMIHGAIEFLL